MPYQVIKHRGKWRILKLLDNSIAKPIFKSRKTAQTQAINWKRYMHGRSRRRKLKY